MGPCHRCTTDHRRVDDEWLTALACTTVDGHPIALTGAENALMQVWDLLTRAVPATLTGHRAEVTEVTCGVLDGTPVVVTASKDTTVRIWDLSRARRPHIGMSGRWARSAACDRTPLLCLSVSWNLFVSGHHRSRLV